MDQIKTGALRDFKAGGVEVHLIGTEQVTHPLILEADELFLVHVIPDTQVGITDQGDYIMDHDNQTIYQFDNWNDAEDKYLELASEYGAELKIQKWKLENWK